MLGQPLGTAWSHLLDSLTLKSLEGMDEWERRRAVLAVVHMWELGSDAKDSKASLGDWLSEHYPSHSDTGLMDLYTLRRLCKHYYLTSKGVIEPLETDEDGRIIDENASVWDDAEIQQVMESHIGRAEAQQFRSIDTEVELAYLNKKAIEKNFGHDSELECEECEGTGFYTHRRSMNRVEPGFKHQKGRPCRECGGSGWRFNEHKIMRAFHNLTERDEGRAWTLSEGESYQNELDTLTHQRDNDWLPPELSHLKDATDEQIQMAAKDQAKSKAHQGILGDPKKNMSPSTIATQLSYLRELWARGACLTRVGEILSGRAGLDQLDEETRDRYYAMRRRYVNDPTFETNVERLLEIAERAQPRRRVARLRREAKEQEMVRRIKPWLYAKLLKQYRIQAEEEPVYRNAVDYVKFSLDNPLSEMEHEKRLWDEGIARQARGAITKMAVIIQTAGLSPPPDWGTIQDVNLRRLQSTWMGLAPEAQNLLLSVRLGKSSLLSFLLRIGVNNNSLYPDAARDLAHTFNEESGPLQGKGVEAIEAYLERDDDEGPVGYKPIPLGPGEYLPAGVEPEQDLLPEEVPAGAAMSEEELLPGLEKMRYPSFEDKNDKLWTTKDVFDCIREWGHRNNFSKERGGIPPAHRYITQAIHEMMFRPVRHNLVFMRDAENVQPHELTAYLLGNLSGMEGPTATEFLQGLLWHGQSQYHPEFEKDFYRLHRLRDLLLDKNGRPRDYKTMDKEKLSRMYGEDPIHTQAKKTLGRREYLQFMSQFDEMSKDIKEVECPKCHGTGKQRNRRGKTVDCRYKDLSDDGTTRECTGYRKQRGMGLNGLLRVVQPHGIHPGISEAVRDYVDGLMIELLGGLNYKDRRPPTIGMELPGGVTEAEVDRDNVIPGLIRRALEIDREYAANLDMFRECPTCKGKGTEIITYPDKTQKPRVCSDCNKEHPKMEDGKTVYKVPDVQAMHHQFGQYGVDDRGAKINVSQMKTYQDRMSKVQDRYFDTNGVDPEDEEVSHALSKHYIPADGKGTPHDLHPMCRLQELHTPEGPLSMEGLMQARKEAREETRGLTGSARRKAMVDYLTNRYRTIFENGLNVFHGVERDIMEATRPSGAADCGGMRELFGMLARDAPEEEIAQHMSLVRHEDSDGRDTRTDNGWMGIEDCEDCGGEGHPLGFDGKPNRAVICRGCVGTGNDGVRMQILRNPKIFADMDDRDIAKKYYLGQLDVEYGKELGFDDNEHIHPSGKPCLFCNAGQNELKAVDGVYDEKYIKFPRSYRIHGGPEIGRGYERSAATLLGNARPHKLALQRSTRNIVEAESNYNLLIKLMVDLRKYRQGETRNIPYGRYYDADSRRDVTAGKGGTASIEEHIGQVRRLLSREDVKEQIVKRLGVHHLPADLPDDWADAGQFLINIDKLKLKMKQCPTCLGKGVMPGTLVPCSVCSPDEGVTRGKGVLDYKDVLLDAPCPFCNRLKALGELSGPVSSIREHVKEDEESESVQKLVAARMFTGKLACPEARKRFDARDGTVPSLTNFTVTELYGRLEDELGMADDEKKYMNVLEQLEPTIDEAIESRRRGGGLDPIMKEVKPGQILRMATIPWVPRSSIVHAVLNSRYGRKAIGGAGEKKNTMFGSIDYRPSGDNKTAMLYELSKVGEGSYLPQNEGENEDMKRLMAMHILAPDVQVERHGNPLNLPGIYPGLGNSLKAREFSDGKDKYEWARRILGKEHDDLHLTGDERDYLEENSMRLLPLLQLEKVWNEHLHRKGGKNRRLLDEYAEDAGFDTPLSIFNLLVDTGGAPYEGDLIPAGENAMDLILEVLHNEAYIENLDDTMAHVDYDYSGFMLPYEGHPSTYWWWNEPYKEANSELVQAWKNHDDDTLARIAGDQWVVTGKSLPEIIAHKFPEGHEHAGYSLMDVLWQGITKKVAVTHYVGEDGNEVNWLKTNQKKIPAVLLSGINWPTLDQILGLHGEEHTQLKTLWWQLQREIATRADQSDLSKERMKRAGNIFDQTPANPMATPTRCPGCHGAKHHKTIALAADWQSRKEPFPETDAKGRVLSHVAVPHVAGVDEGGVPTGDRVKLAISGGYYHWESPEAIRYIHEHQTTPYGETGRKGWLDYFESQKRHGFIPAEWEVMKPDDSGYTDEYTNWVSAQEYQCIPCEGLGHCGICGGFGFHKRSEEDAERIHEIQMANHVLRNRESNIKIDKEGNFSVGSKVPYSHGLSAPIVLQGALSERMGDNYSRAFEDIDYGKDYLARNQPLTITDEETGAKTDLDTLDEHITKHKTEIIENLKQGYNTAVKRFWDEKHKKRRRAHKEAVEKWRVRRGGIIDEHGRSGAELRPDPDDPEGKTLPWVLWNPLLSVAENRKLNRPLDKALAILGPKPEEPERKDPVETPPTTLEDLKKKLPTVGPVFKTGGYKGKTLGQRILDQENARVGQSHNEANLEQLLGSDPKRYLADIRRGMRDGIWPVSVWSEHPDYKHLITDSDRALLRSAERPPLGSPRRNVPGRELEDDRYAGWRISPGWKGPEMPEGFIERIREAERDVHQRESTDQWAGGPPMDPDFVAQETHARHGGGPPPGILYPSMSNYFYEKTGLRLHPELENEIKSSGGTALLAKLLYAYERRKSDDSRRRLYPEGWGDSNEQEGMLSPPSPIEGRPCEHPNCVTMNHFFGAVQEAISPSLGERGKRATHGPSQSFFGSNYNPYGDYCDEHHAEVMAEMEQPRPWRQKVAGGAFAEDFIRHCLTLGEPSPYWPAFQHPLPKGDYEFVGLHQFGSKGGYIPYFRKLSSGALCSIFELGLGLHTTQRSGALGEQTMFQDEKERKERGEGSGPSGYPVWARGRGFGYMDNPGWDTGRVMPGIPKVDIGPILDEYATLIYLTDADGELIRNDAGHLVKKYPHISREQYKLPKRQKICPYCLHSIRRPRHGDDTVKCDGNGIPGQYGCGSEVPTEDIRKSPYHVDSRTLLFHGKRGPGTAAEHIQDRHGRDRLKRRLYEIMAGNKDPAIETCAQCWDGKKHTGFRTSERSSAWGGKRITTTEPCSCTRGQVLSKEARKHSIILRNSDGQRIGKTGRVLAEGESPVMVDYTTEPDKPISKVWKFNGKLFEVGVETLAATSAVTLDVFLEGLKDRLWARWPDGKLQRDVKGKKIMVAEDKKLLYQIEKLMQPDYRFTEVHDGFHSNTLGTHAKYNKDAYHGIESLKRIDHIVDRVNLTMEKRKHSTAKMSKKLTDSIMSLPGAKQFSDKRKGESGRQFNPDKCWTETDSGYVLTNDFREWLNDLDLIHDKASGQRKKAAEHLIGLLGDGETIEEKSKPISDLVALATKHNKHYRLGFEGGIRYQEDKSLSLPTFTNAENLPGELSASDYASRLLQSMEDGDPTALIPINADGNTRARFAQGHTHGIRPDGFLDAMDKKAVEEALPNVDRFHSVIMPFGAAMHAMVRGTTSQTRVNKALGTINALRIGDRGVTHEDVLGSNVAMTPTTTTTVAQESGWLPPFKSIEDESMENNWWNHLDNAQIEKKAAEEEAPPLRSDQIAPDDMEATMTGEDASAGKATAHGSPEDIHYGGGAISEGAEQTGEEDS